MIEPYHVVLAEKGGGFTGELKIIQPGAGIPLGGFEQILHIETMIGKINGGIPQDFVSPHPAVPVTVFGCISNNFFMKLFFSHQDVIAVGHT